jgi:hypothetical protein
MYGSLEIGFDDYRRYAPCGRIVASDAGRLDESVVRESTKEHE